MQQLVQGVSVVEIPVPVIIQHNFLCNQKTQMAIRSDRPMSGASLRIGTEEERFLLIVGMLFVSLAFGLK